MTGGDPAAHHHPHAPDQVDQYRLEHGLDPDDPLRDHNRDRLAVELGGLGADWWDVHLT